MIKLPRLTTEIDCEPIGYKGLLVRFWLNPPSQEYSPPWAEIQDSKERAKAQQEAPGWESAFYHGMARHIEAVVVPEDMSTTGKAEEIPISSAEELWKLEHRADFDPQVFMWASTQYMRLRNERLKAELKN